MLVRFVSKYIQYFALMSCFFKNPNQLNNTVLFRPFNTIVLLEKKNKKRITFRSPARLLSAVGVLLSNTNPKPPDKQRLVPYLFKHIGNSIYQARCPADHCQSTRAGVKTHSKDCSDPWPIWKLVIQHKPLKIFQLHGCDAAKKIIGVFYSS